MSADHEKEVGRLELWGKLLRAAYLIAVFYLFVYPLMKLYEATLGRLEGREHD